MTEEKTASLRARAPQDPQTHTYLGADGLLASIEGHTEPLWEQTR